MGYLWVVSSLMAHVFTVPESDARMCVYILSELPLKVGDLPCQTSRAVGRLFTFYPASEQYFIHLKAILQNAMKSSTTQ